MDSCIYVTCMTDLHGLHIVMEVADIPTVYKCGLFHDINIENGDIIEAKCNKGVTKKDLDDDPNIIFYTIPKYKPI